MGEGVDREQTGLLAWLELDGGQIGECDGTALDAAVAAELVEVTRPAPPGRDPRFGYVDLTEAGREALAHARTVCPHPHQAATLRGGLACGVCGVPMAEGGGHG